MMSQEKSHHGQDRGGIPVKFVTGPVATLGIRNALRRAFSCEEEAADSFDRLLARLN
jgi:hypothetical protein